MRTPPTNWTTLMAQPHETETRVDINDVSYYGYDGNSGIWSLSTRNALFENFSVGNCHAGQIDIVLVNPETIPTMAKMELYVRLHGNGVESETRYAVDDGGHSAHGRLLIPVEGAYIKYSDYLLKNGDDFVLPTVSEKAFITIDNYEEVQEAIKGKFIVFWDDTDIYYAKDTVTISPAPQGLDVGEIYPDYTVKEYDAAYSEWTRKGVYFIDTREWDAQHELLTITGYDAMLKAEQPYYKPPVTITGWPKVDTAVVAEICTRLGVELDTRTVLNKSYMVQLPAVSTDGEGSDSLRTTLGYIGAAYGGNWIITDDGKLRLVPLVPPPETHNLVTQRGERITFGGVGILV